MRGLNLNDFTRHLMCDMTLGERFDKTITARGELRGLENIEIPFVGAASAAKQKDIAAEAAPTLCMVYL